MIKVSPKPEASDFDAKVRQQGLAFLLSNGIREGVEVPENFKWDPFWRNCIEDLYDGYEGICAYLGWHFEFLDGTASVDHYLPKKKFPQQAYNWANFRLATRQRNSLKGDHEDVLDPFEIENGWFQVDFLTGKVSPSPDLEKEISEQIDATIKRLKLNESRLKLRRAELLIEISQSMISPENAQRYYPFLFIELKRQGFLP